MSKGRDLKPHIGIFGRRNNGKSSFINVLLGQEVAIVSEQAGTTTDPVEKPMELLPIGPVLFIDTAGIDDSGALGEMRVQRTRQIFDRTDVGIIVTIAGAWNEFEEAILNELIDRKIPVIIVFNKMDITTPDDTLAARLKGMNIACVETSASTGTGLLDLRAALVRNAPEEFINAPAIVGDLFPPVGLFFW